MSAHLTKSYKVSRKIAHRNAMLVDQLAAQLQPRSNGQMWCVNTHNDISIFYGFASFKMPAI
jgi:hypothetical protein